MAPDQRVPIVQQAPEGGAHRHPPERLHPQIVAFQTAPGRLASGALEQARGYAPSRQGARGGDRQPLAFQVGPAEQRQGQPVHAGLDPDGKPHRQGHPGTHRRRREPPARRGGQRGGQQGKGGGVTGEELLENPPAQVAFLFTGRQDRRDLEKRCGGVSAGHPLDVVDQPGGIRCLDAGVETLRAQGFERRRLLIGGGDGQRGEPLTPDPSALVHAVYLVELGEPNEVIPGTIHVRLSQSETTSQARPGRCAQRLSTAPRSSACVVVLTWSSLLGRPYLVVLTWSSYLVFCVLLACVKGG